MKIKLGLIALAAFFVISSCKKDSTEDPAPTTPTNTITTAALTANFWERTGFTSSPAIDYYNNGHVVTDVYALMDTCAQDFHYKFNSGGSYTNGVSINCTFPIYNSGAWSLDSVNSKLNLVSSTSVATQYSIITLNTNTLKVSSVEIRSGVSYTFTQTFTKE
ncbi:MAG: DUF5004 domain-containing protein [Bacteroidetes bacterium]|nr:DUF5004 domain-containing protein [Bacteroidota bacterium]